MVTSLRNLTLKRLDGEMVLVLNARSEVMPLSISMSSLLHYLLLLEDCKVLTSVIYGLCACLSVDSDLIQCQLILGYLDCECWHLAGGILDAHQ